MKDFYYILGLNQTASIDEIKKAYHKLSLKFHPDKNDGDEFFTERFKEIQEAYETLSDSNKRTKYDNSRTQSATSEQTNQGSNFSPEIEYFKINKSSIEFDQEITFSWKTINADKVSIKPFGLVQSIGQKSFRIKDFKNKHLTFEIVAENTNIGRQVKSTLTVLNKTYEELYNYYENIIEEEKKKSKGNENNTDQFSNTDPHKKSKGFVKIYDDQKEMKIYLFIIIIVILAIFIAISF